MVTPSQAYLSLFTINSDISPIMWEFYYLHFTEKGAELIEV